MLPLYRALRTSYIKLKDYKKAEIAFINAIFVFTLHLPETIVVFWLFLGLTLIVFKKKKEKRAMEYETVKADNREKKYHLKFKPFLYIAIITLTIFLCFALCRLFVAQVYWYYGAQEAEKGNLDQALTI